ncbi:MAG: ABC transporter ATP-binding protein [Gemmatimonadota bacterium]|nr:ABC transporter ATP-binding protein [Gemmatimonadota bacterium]
MIDAEGLTYTYPGAEDPAVRSIDFKVERGEIFGFLGPNGAGKSTAQKVLIGLLREYTGRVRIFERDLRSWGNSYYERIGVTFEVPNHYLKLTALENLRYFRTLYAGETEAPGRLLEQVGLDEDGDRRVGEFSRGMRGRLNFARALLNRPELLFLDEPTAGLDPVGSLRIRDLILERREAGATVFLTTHDMAVADELCDRVAFIVDGDIRLVDAPQRMKLQYGERMLRVEYGSDAGLQQAEFPLDGLADHAGFQDILRSAYIQTMHSQETTLEDVFVQVTGRALT